MPTTRRQVLLSAGALAGASMMPAARPTAAAMQSPQAPPRAGRAAGLAPADALSVFDFERAFPPLVSPATLDYVNGAAADEITLRWNRESFDRIRLRPRVLVDVTRLDTRVNLFGQEMAFPILLAPTGGHKRSHPEGEQGTARGAGAARAAMVVSTMASTAVEDIARVATHPLWFQLYVLRDRAFTKDLVQRAESAGVKAICLTVDTPVQGPRNRQTRGEQLAEPPVDRPHLKGLKSARGATELEMFSPERAPDLTWKDVAWLLSFAKVPVLLKGVINGTDADRAVKEGAGGIIVSNHGGRNLDTSQATVDALPEVVRAVGGRVPVLMDGGIRRGTDVVKALALGAKAVLIGRPFVWGLASAGSAGVTRVLNILQTELQMTMASLGRPDIASLDRTILWDDRG